MKANRHESARAWVQAWARRWGFVATKTSSRTSQVRQFPLQLLALEDRLTPTVDLTFNLLAGWTPITPTNGQHDFVNDQQTGSGSLPQDVVGNNNHRAAYLKYDTGTNSGSTSDDYVAFRIRVNGTSDSTNISDGFTSFGFLGADANGDGAIDFFIGAYKPHATNGGRIGIYDADGSAGNTGPSTTGIAGSPTVVYTSSTAGYGDLWRFQVVGDSSNFAIDPDYLLSFQISVADINANLSAFGLSTPVGPTTPFRFIVGTAAQDNAFNQDISGVQGFSATDSRTWAAMGVLSPSMSLDGAPLNAAPTTSNDSFSIGTSQNYTLTAAKFPFSDADAGDTFQSIRVLTLPSSGTLKLSGVAITAGQIITVANINAGNLVYQAPASSSSISFTFNVIDSEYNESVSSGTMSVTIASNTAPTLSAVSNLTGGTEDTAYTITYASLLAASNAADVDGNTLSFRIEALSTGTLTKGGVAVTPGTTLLSTGESLVWTPAQDANGTLAAFTVTAWDGGLASSPAVQVNIVTAAVNDAPTLNNPGRAISFDGVDDYVQIPSNSFPRGNSNYTIEAWIKPASDCNSAIIMWGAASPNSSNNLVYVSGSKTLINQWSWNDYSVTVDLTDGNWHHVAATYDGTNRNLYADGVLIGSSAASGNNISITDDSGLPAIGRSPWNYFKGGIDDVRVWTVARTGSEIASSINGVSPSSTGLVAYYKMDEGSGTTTANSSTSVASTVGTLTNGPSWNAGSSSNLNFTGGTEDTSYEITYAQLAAQPDEADVDGDALSFLIDSVSTGVVEKWNSTTSAWDSIIAGTTTIGAGEKLRWTPAANANGTLNAFTVKAYDGALTSATAVQVQVVVAAVAEAPTLSTISNVTGASEDTAYTVTYAALLAASNAVEVDGDALSFRIVTVSSGTLTKGGVAVTAGTTLLSTGESLVWTPAQDANGTLPAFTVTAWDGGLASSPAVQVNIVTAAVNDAPTLTTVSNFTSGTEDTSYEITYAQLAAQADEADLDGDALSFLIDSVSTGVVEKWNSTTSAWDSIAAGTTTIGAGEKLRWTPAANANGTLNAFTVKAYDGALASVTAVQVQVVIAAVADAPVLTSMTALTGATEDTSYEITYAQLVTNSDVADADGDAISFRIEAVNSGILEKWNGSSWVAVVAGTTLISTGEKLRLTPVANASGTLNAFTVKAYDGALSSATAVQVQVVFNPTSDAPTLSTISTLTGAFEDTAYEISHAALLAASNAADADGDTLSFKIDAVVTGSLETWDGSSWSPVVYGTTLIAPGGKVRWTPAQDANGTIIAFTVKAFDGVLESTTAAQVKVAVAPVNDAPVIYTGLSDTIRLVTGSSNPIIRFAIPTSGVTVGDRVRVSYFGQTQISTPLTITDMANGYIDIQLGAALTLQDGTSDLNTVPVKWIDWTSSTSTTANGTLTTETGTITATLTSTSNLMNVQTNGGGNYFIPTTPFESPGVAAPTAPDIVQFGQSGDRTLTFSSEVQNLYYAFVSMNGNGYRFDRDFDILSQAITSPGYWGSGEARKIIEVDPVTGVTYYNLQCISSEPHGVIRFKGAFTSVSWTNPTTEYWHGFTVGIKTGTSDLQSVTGQFINPSNTVLANLPGLVVQYDATQAGRTGTLDATVRSTSILETDAPLSTNGSISMYDIEAADVVTARVDSVAVSGATSRLTLSNAAIKAFLSATTTDTTSLQYAKINWTFNSGTENFNWLGTGEEITFSYTVTADDGAGGTASTTVDITIVGTDDRPTLTTIASITGGTEDIPFEITYADLIAAANEADIDNDPWFRIEAVSTGTLAKYDATSSTWIAVTAGTTEIASGDKVRFTPATNANGTVNAFTVKAFDGYMASSTAVQVKVVLTAFNDAPTANNATLTTIAEDVSIASNTGTAVSVITAYCTDVDGVAVTGIAITAVNNTNGIWEYSTNSGTNWTAISGVSDSSALLLAGNIAAHRVRFRPNADWNGTTTITFRAWDRTTGTAGTLEDVTVNGGTTAYSSGSATGTMTVAPVNDIPVVTGSSIVWTGNTSYSGRFSATDIDSASFTYSVSTNPAHGSVTILGNGFIYMPTDGYVGSDSFAFRAHDGADYSLPATINFTLAAPPSFTISGGTTVNETPNASVSVNFQLSVSGTSTAPMFLDYATAGFVPGSGQGYTATEGLDYTGTSGRLIYQPGDTSSHTFNIPIIDDTVAETAETFALRVTNKPKWIYGPDLNKADVWTRYVTPATLTGLGSIVMTADNAFELYVNGVQVGSGNNWGSPYTALADFNGNDVVAIKVTNHGGPGSLIGRITIGGVVIGTSAFWKITETAPTGTSWRTDPSFNDSAWSYATEYGDYGVSPWGSSAAVIVQNLGSTFSNASNYTVTINPNDNPPSVTGTQTQSFASDLTIQPFRSVVASVTTEVTILDIDIPVENVSVTVTPSSFTSGTLSNLGTGTLTNGVYTVSGTQAAVTAALRGLVFTPSTAAKAAGVVTTTFTIFADDGATHTTTNTATQVTSINLPPVASNPSLYLMTANPTFSITYTDPNGMDAASITTANITAWVGTTQLTIASVVYNPASSTTGTATYTISPPVGGWSSINGKKIDIRLVANQVKDAFGLVMAPVPSVIGGLPLAQVLVDTVPPTAVMGGPPHINIASQASDYVFTVLFADPIPVGGLASGVNTATIPSTLVVSETGGSRTVTANRTALVGLLATYKITTPAGSWTTFDGATLSVALPGTYADLAGNTGVAQTRSILIDTTAPTVQYTATRPVTGSNELSKLDMVFSESVSYVDYSDLMLERSTNAGTTVVKLPGAVLNSVPASPGTFSLAGFSTNNTKPGGNYSFGFNPVSDIVDNVGNPVDQTSTLDWYQMEAALKPVISTSAPLINNLTSVPVTINFGKAVTGFTFSDIVITKNGVPVSGLGLTLTETILGKRFTFNLPTTASATETWNFFIPASAAVTNDADAWDTGDSNILEFVVDREPPTEILTPWPNQFVDGGSSNLNNLTYLCTFSDPVKNLPRDAITVTNGKIVSLFIIEGTDSKKWKLDVKPNLLATGPVVVTAQVRAAAYADVAGNLGVASAVVSANVYRDLAVKSTLALNGATLASKVGTSVTTIPVKVTFTQPVNPATVTAAAFSTMHSTVGGISVAANGLSATFTLTVTNPTGAWDAPIRVSVLGGVVRDLYGNKVLASAPLSWMHDGTGPTVVLSTRATAIRLGESVSVGIKFSEMMDTGTFTLSKIQVQLNGVDVDPTQLILKGTGSSFTVTLKPGARGTLSVRLRSSVTLATDLVGNALTSTGNTINVKIS